MRKRRKRVLWIFFMLLALSVAAWFLVPVAERTRYPLKFREQVMSMAKEYALDPALVAAVIHTESHYQPDAVSRVGARGLMQLMPATAEWMAGIVDITYNEKDLLLPEINIRLGCAFLAMMLEDFDGDVTLALCAYNAGGGNVRKWLKDSQYSSDGKALTEIPFPETKQYVKKVEKAYEKYKKLYTWD